MKQILILGAGFAGITAALNLSKQVSAQDAEIIIIDKEDYHLFTTNLYEVATAEEEMTSMGQLKKTITLPIKEVLNSGRVRLVKGTVKLIDQEKKQVSLEDGKNFSYDYLVIATGSVSDYFNIEGAENFSIPLKTLKDALKIRNQVEFAIQAHRLDTSKKLLRFVVAGGGYTGVEFVSELSNLVKILSWKYGYPPQKMEIVVVEGTSQLIPGLSDRLSRDAYKRLEELGVRVMLSSFIVKVTDGFLDFKNGERLAYDLLVWSAGVKARTMNFSKELALDKKGRILTTPFLQAQNWPNIFVTGDIACAMSAKGMPAPPTAQDAVHQGRYVARALAAQLANKKIGPYSVLKHGFIVSIGGKWAIMSVGFWYISGFLGYLIRQGANLRYYGSLVGWWQATKYVVFQMEIYSRND